MITDEEIQRLVDHRKTGFAILHNELKTVDTDASEAEAIRHEIEWVATALEIAPPFGPAFVASLEPIGEIKNKTGEEETRLLWDVPVSVARNNDHFWSLVTLAVRLHRIEAKLEEIDRAWQPSAPPKKQGRPPGGVSQAENAVAWAAEIRNRPKGMPKRDVAREIAKREERELATVEREARRAEEKRGKEKIR